MTLKSPSRIFVATLFTATALAATVLPLEAEAPPATTTIVKPTAPSIRVVSAERKEVVETLSVNGTVVAREEAAVGTDLNGMIVTALNADEGDTVRKGDVLATLDRSMLDTQLVEIEATRAQAQANIDQVDAQIADAEVAVRQSSEALERVRSLQTKGVATKAELDNAVNGFDSATARLNSARKALVASRAQLAVIDAKKQNVMLQLSKTEVRAPADGLVLSRNATLGGIVSASGAPLFRIAINAEFELAADVSETDLARLEPAMPAKLWLAGRKDTVGGHVRRISPEVDARSRLGSVRISLDQGSKAQAGNFGRGDIEITRREGIVVPAASVVYRDSDAFLQRVEEGRIHTVPVVLGVRSGADVEVLSGIDAGAEIVSRAGTFVADGDLVTPVRDELTGAIAQ
ncbi:MAG: efflux RND transporter periplasmic adaptor subunit [Rhizobiaceae bacterium]|nr:efflux RND transporter periplasmic adaptor subunit [Rhizobiaceae bacterium]